MSSGQVRPERQGDLPIAQIRAADPHNCATWPSACTPHPFGRPAKLGLPRQTTWPRQPPARLEPSVCPAAVASRRTPVHRTREPASDDAEARRSARDSINSTNELDQCHRRRVATTRLQLRNPRVSARRLNKPGRDHLEQLRGRQRMIDLGHDQLAMRVTYPRARS